MSAVVLIVGAGALGSHLVQFARNLPVEWIVVDFDRVENKNVASQFHSRMGRGRNKAQALAQAMNGLFGLRIEAVPHKLGPDNAATLIGRANVVVDCTDNAVARCIIGESSASLGTPCLHGALAADGSYGRVEWAPLFVADEGGVGQATCEDGQHLPFIATVSARLARSLQFFVEEELQVSMHVRPDGVVRVG